MRWLIAVYGAFVALGVSEVYAQPGGHVTEERREYYQKTSKVIDSPIIFSTDGGTHSSYTTTGDALTSSWAQSHMDEIRKMADKLRSEYNIRAMSAGVGRKGGHRMRNRYTSTSVVDFPSFAGKSQEELDAFTRQMTEQMINDMKSGKILYSQIAQPNWFEAQAAQKLEAMSQTQDYSSQQQTASDVQQQNQDIFGAEDFRQYPQTIGGGGFHRTTEKKHFEYSSSHGGYQPIPTYASELEDLNKKEEQSSVVYPSMVTIIGGNRFVTKKNCTTAGTTVGSLSPYFPNYRTHTSTYDKDIQNILEHGRDIPIVVEQGHSTYNKEQSSYNKQQEQQSVPVYQGSYFTDNHYDSQYNQNIPIQSQIQSQTSGTREGSQYNRQFQSIPIGGSSQTIHTSSTTLRERENQQIPVVIPTSQTTSTSDSYSQSETQRRVPVVYPSSSTHRESSSFESVREAQPVPRPTPSSSRHSIYRHLERETEVIPDYKPVVTIDSQTIDSVNQELNRYFSQRPSAIARTENTEHVERNREVQGVTVVPDVTITIHEQEQKDRETERRIQPVQPTIATAQQTTSSDRQQSSSVLYRPSYPAYGSQMSRNETEYKQTSQSRYPQTVVSGSSFEKQEEDRHYTREQQQQIPIYGQTGQNTEEIRTSEVYRSRDQPRPIVVGGSSTYHESHEERYTGQRQQQIPQTTSYQESHEEQYTDQRQKQIPQTTSYQESHEEQYTDQRQKQIPQTTTYQESHEEHYSGQRQQQVPQTINYQENREEQYISEQERQKQIAQTFPQSSEKITESNQTTVYQRPGPIYISGVNSQQVESDDQIRESTQYRQYPAGHRTSQVTSETEDSYWSRHHARPQNMQTTHTQSETEYRESSGSRRPQSGILTSQTTQEHEVESEDLRRRPGQTGYSVTSQINETTSSSSSGSIEAAQHPVVIASNQESVIEGGSQSGSQVVVSNGFQGIDRDRNDSYVEIRDGKLYYPTAPVSREREDQEYERNRQQGGYRGGMHLEHSEYGSHVNRSMTTGGGGIGYITHHLTIEEQEELWRRQQEERRRQQLISTGIFDESSLNRSVSYGGNGEVQVNVAQQGVYDGDEERLANGTAHLDKAEYGTSVDLSSTSASGKPPGKIVSKDRGDQPPQHYEEDYDMNEAEPGIGYYLTEPQAGNQVAAPTTVKYPEHYTAPLAPLVVVEKDKLDSNKQTSAEVWPTTAGETEVQRSYHRKQTTITQTIPVLIGPNGEVIQGSGSASTVSGSQREGEASGSLTGNYDSSSGAYRSQITGGATISGQNLIDQHQDTDQLYQQQGEEQSYQSQSSSHQVAGGDGNYGSAAYGSEARYQVRPGASYSGSGASRYTTGSTSSSVSYPRGGSYSQASAYGHQQQEDDSLESQLGQQLTVGAFEIGGDQQSQDLTQQFVDDGEESEDFKQGVEGYRHSHGEYSQSDGGSHQGQQSAGQSGSSYYRSHSAYASHSSSAAGGSINGSSSSTSDQIPAEVHEEVDSKTSDQDKPGFWRRIGQKAKDLFG